MTWHQAIFLKRSGIKPCFPDGPSQSLTQYWVTVQSFLSKGDFSSETLARVQVDIDLPQIAVIGAQSAGKSLLIESISGITLPRASGTCTRFVMYLTPLIIILTLEFLPSCPTECRLSRNNAPWKCVVSLCFITDRSGQNLGQATTQPFGESIYDKTQVEDRIRRAQLAILNPTKPAKYFLEGDNDKRHEAELSFSKNFVSLEISGPDVADLSFCDLPGAFFRLLIFYNK